MSIRRLTIKFLNLSNIWGFSDYSKFADPRWRQKHYTVEASQSYNLKDVPIHRLATEYMLAHCFWSSIKHWYTHHVENHQKSIWKTIMWKTIIGKQAINTMWKTIKKSQILLSNDLVAAANKLPGDAGYSYRPGARIKWGFVTSKRLDYAWILAYPYAPCIVYLPTKLGDLWGKCW